MLGSLKTFYTFITKDFSSLYVLQKNSVIDGIRGQRRLHNLGGIHRAGGILRNATFLIISQSRVRNAEECS